MTLKTFKPYTKSTRGTILVSKSNLWKGKPYKPLTSSKRSSKGRNNLGRITSRNHGGGHKQRYRNIDFHRSGSSVVEVERIEYDPNRSSYIILVKNDKEKKYYYIAPQGIKVGDKIENGENCEIKNGNCMELKNIPSGMQIHNVEIIPGGGGKIAPVSYTHLRAHET